MTHKKLTVEKFLEDFDYNVHEYFADINERDVDAEDIDKIGNRINSEFLDRLAEVEIDDLTAKIDGWEFIFGLESKSYDNDEEGNSIVTAWKMWVTVVTPERVASRPAKTEPTVTDEEFISIFKKLAS